MKTNRPKLARLATVAPDLGDVQMYSDLVVIKR